MDRVVIVAAVLLIASALSAWWRAREGRVHHSVAEADDRLALLAGGRRTFLQFTAPDCHPCVAARRVLDAVATERGLRVVAVDVGADPGLARQHRILRAPTTLLVEPDGTARARIGGVPDPAELRELVGF